MQSQPFHLQPTIARYVAPGGYRPGRDLLRPDATLMARRSPLASIELVRLLSALGIVWFHMRAPGAQIAYSALSLFLILTAFFTVETAVREGRARFWIGRLQRIGLPWIAWSAFYLGLDWYRYGGLSPETEAATPLFLLLVGTSLHLWFLPFVLLVSGPIRLAARAVRGSRATLALAAALVPPALVALDLHGYMVLPAPFAQWSVAFPAVCYGLVAGQGKRWGVERAPALYLAALILVGLSVGSVDGLMQLALAAAAFEFCLRLDLDASLAGVDLVALGRLSFGIYLIHPFFMLVYFRLFSGNGRSFGATLLVFLMSALGTAALRRLPGLRRLV